MREASPALPVEPDALARLIKAVPLRLTGTKSLERAISSAGGVPFAELDEHLMLRRLPGVFVAGEMLDWEAPTGGYLLQASFATGIAAAKGVLIRLGIPDAALTASLSSATRQT
jgi:predicted flavoprotein YhiN